MYGFKARTAGSNPALSATLPFIDFPPVIFLISASFVPALKVRFCLFCGCLVYNCGGKFLVNGVSHEKGGFKEGRLGEES